MCVAFHRLSFSNRRSLPRSLVSLLFAKRSGFILSGGDQTPGVFKAERLHLLVRERRFLQLQRSGLEVEERRVGAKEQARLGNLRQQIPDARSEEHTSELQ